MQTPTRTATKIELDVGLNTVKVVVTSASGRCGNADLHDSRSCGVAGAPSGTCSRRVVCEPHDGRSMTTGHLGREERVLRVCRTPGILQSIHDNIDGGINPDELHKRGGPSAPSCKTLLVSDQSHDSGQSIVLESGVPSRDGQRIRSGAWQE